MILPLANEIDADIRERIKADPRMMDLNYPNQTQEGLPPALRIHRMLTSYKTSYLVNAMFVVLNGNKDICRNSPHKTPKYRASLCMLWLFLVFWHSPGENRKGSSQVLVPKNQQHKNADGVLDRRGFLGSTIQDIIVANLEAYALRSKARRTRREEEVVDPADMGHGECDIIYDFFEVFNLPVLCRDLGLLGRVLAEKKIEPECLYTLPDEDEKKFFPILESWKKEVTELNDRELELGPLPSVVITQDEDFYPATARYY